MLRTIALASALSAVAGMAAAVTVDFEDLGFGPADQTVFDGAGGDTYASGGITFSSSEDFQLVGVGGGGLNQDGFVPNDTPTPQTFGTAFITGDFNDNADLTMEFDSVVKDLMFEIADIDGGNDNTAPGVGFDDPAAPNNREFFDFIAKLDGSIVSTISIDSSDLTGPDGEVVSVGFGGVLLDEVMIVAQTQGGTRNIGWGLDNISATAVPLPAGAVLMLTGLVGLGAVRRLRR